MRSRLHCIDPDTSTSVPILDLSMDSRDQDTDSTGSPYTPDINDSLDDDGWSESFFQKLNESLASGDLDDSQMVLILSSLRDKVQKLEDDSEAMKGSILWCAVQMGSLRKLRGHLGVPSCLTESLELSYNGNKKLFALSMQYILNVQCIDWSL